MIGVLGGVFDPIHFGHLRIAVEALETYPLSEIRFMPCQLPVHKKPPAAAAHRLRMIELAIAGQKKFKLDLSEINRQTPSYMAETLKTLRRQNRCQKLGLILGADALGNFTHWHCYKDILTMAELFIMPRVLAISSTQIRGKIKTGQNPEFLLPSAVLAYIKKQALYL